MKRRTFLTFVAVAVLSTGLLYADQTLKFVTINVWSGLTYEGTFTTKTYETKEERTFRYGILVNELKRLDPDIIAVNEANMLPGYARRLARDLEYDYVFDVGLGGVRLGPVGFPTNLREGDVILAKKHLNLALVGSRGLSGGYAGNFASFHFKDATQVIAAKITVGKTEVLLCNTHWHASEFAGNPDLKILVDRFTDGQIGGEEIVSRISDAVEGSAIRLEEAAKMIEYIAEIAGELPVILMGDFNALPDSNEIGALLNEGFEDSWNGNRIPGYTWDEVGNTNILKYMRADDSTLPPRQDRIDFIFFRGEGVSAASSRVVLDEPVYDVHPSDHYGVMSEITFPE